MWTASWTDPPRTETPSEPPSSWLRATLAVMLVCLCYGHVSSPLYHYLSFWQRISESASRALFYWLFNMHAVCACQLCWRRTQGLWVSQCQGAHFAGKCVLRRRVGCCRVIHTFMPKILDNFRFSSASNVGRGGMEAKVASAWDAAQSGVTTVIANGKMPSVLLQASLWSPEYFCPGNSGSQWGEACMRSCMLYRTQLIGCRLISRKEFPPAQGCTDACKSGVTELKALLAGHGGDAGGDPLQQGCGRSRGQCLEMYVHCGLRGWRLSGDCQRPGPGCQDSVQEACSLPNRGEICQLWSAENF